MNHLSSSKISDADQGLFNFPEDELFADSG